MKDSHPQKLTPLTRVKVVTSNGLKIITENRINSGELGEKAYGLSCLPPEWTLPWFVLSSECFQEYVGAKNDEKKNEVIKAWSKKM